MGNRLQRVKPKNGQYFLLTFFVGLIAAAVLFIPFIVYQGGVFYYYGDFNVQEIPFYQMLHSAVRNGELGWNHLTDLGSDTISSYSFYLLGSPFFWLTIPFDNSFIPNLIGPLLILKFACASGAAYLYLQRYVRYKPFAVLGGLLYAFSGFSIYNVFFFHFHEPMIVFPLLLPSALWITSTALTSASMTFVLGHFVLRKLKNLSQYFFHRSKYSLGFSCNVM